VELTPAQQIISGPPPAADSDALLGKTIGSFTITRKLGVGGMGTVYLGEQAAIGSKVAIKVLHEHLCGNASLVQRFYAEARAANVIGHEHIVSIIDLNVIPPSRYYFVMEYLEGKALNEVPRPMAHAPMVHILEQACDALQAAHQHGVVHRDLKPENIILVRRGRNEQFVKLLDFGIAKLFATELAGQQTVAGMIMGTPEFMAPEQTSGQPVDGRTDLYALGVIAYELATGKLPFTSPNLADLFIAHRMHEAKAPHLVNPTVPISLSEAIMKALAKAPEARFQTADAFREALVATLLEAPVKAPIEAPKPAGVAPPPGAPGWKAPSTPGLGVKAASPSGGYPLGLQATSTSGQGRVSGSGSFSGSSPSGSHRMGGGLQATSLPGVGASSAPASRQSGSSPVYVPRGPPGSTPSPVLGVSGPSRSTPSQAVRVDAGASSASAVSYEVRLYETGRAGSRSLRCTDVSRSGMFIHADGALPAVMSQVKLGLLVGGRELLMNGDVVRHVTAEQSQAWGMPVGFGVQLTQLTPAQKETLAALARGQVGGVAAPVADAPADPRAEAALAPYRKHGSASFYELLGVFDDADFAELRQRIRETKKVLEELQRERPLSPRQREEVLAYDRRLDEAHLTVGQPRNRLDYDAARGNWKGAARCIAGGVSVTELDLARRRYLATREKVEGMAHLHFTTGAAWENQRDLQRAQQEYERALALDPLNLAVQQRYQALRRQITSPPPPPKPRR
jgi:serine/threonine-protein kinase